MNELNIADRFAEMWRRSREDGGRSQEYMAKALGVSKRTVQNWEEGYSSPSQLKGFEWFQILGLQPIPYYLELMYPMDFDTASKEHTDEEIEEALIKYIKVMRPSDKRKLLFIIYGNHGSEFNELIEMLCAHFHTPPENRITVAQNICTNFQVAEATDRLIAKNHIMPNIDTLKRAIIRKRDQILGTHDLEKL